MKKISRLLITASLLAASASAVSAATWHYGAWSGTANISTGAVSCYSYYSSFQIPVSGKTSFSSGNGYAKSSGRAGYKTAVKVRARAFYWNTFGYANWAYSTNGSLATSGWDCGLYECSEAGCQTAMFY